MSPQLPEANKAYGIVAKAFVSQTIGGNFESPGLISFDKRGTKPQHRLHSPIYFHFAQPGTQLRLSLCFFFS